MTATLNPLFRFDTFVTGAANRLAVTAAKAVAEAPGTVYNPLFVHARPGLGKTHLLMAIGHAARAVDPRLAVEYLTFDELVEAFDAAVAAGRGDAYRKRFTEIDLLLVDDVQLLAHRREMQAELLRITDVLQAANRQIVCTSDRPPAEIDALGERLVRRFAGGLVVDLGELDYEIRVGILCRKAGERRVSFAAGVLEAVAELEIPTIRELLGALNRLIAHQAVGGTPLEPAQAKALAGATVVGTARAQTNGAGEFDEFLSEIADTLTQRMDAWQGETSPPRAAPPLPSRPAKPRSGIVAPTAGGVKSREKMIWDWPDVADRILEEWR